MLTTDIRTQLHQYIDKADDVIIQSIYAILDRSLNSSEKFSEAELKKFYDRRAKYLKGDTESYTIEEAHNLIIQSRSNK